MEKRMDEEHRSRLRKERRERLKAQLQKPWVAYTFALCSAVVLFMLLSHVDVIYGGVRWVFSILSPVIIGIVLAYILNPLVNFFELRVLKKIRKKEPKHLFSVILAIVSALVVVAGLIVLLVPSVTKSISNMVGSISSYSKNLDRYLANVTAFMERWGLDTSRLSDTIEGWFSKAANYMVENAGKGLSTAVSVGNSLINFGIGFVIMIYFLIGKESLLRGISSLRHAYLSAENYERNTAFLERCHKIFVRFISLNILDAVIIGVLNAIFMLILRMPYNPFISMLVGVTNLIPTFGPIIGVVLGGLILLLNGHPWLTLIFVGFSIILQTFDSYILKPKLYGEGFGVPGVWILIAIVLFGKMFGTLGMLLAVPLAAILTIVYHEFVLAKMQKNRAARDIKEMERMNAMEEEDKAAEEKAVAEEEASGKEEKTDSEK